MVKGCSLLTQAFYLEKRSTALFPADGKDTERPNGCNAVFIGSHLEIFFARYKHPAQGQCGLSYWKFRYVSIEFAGL